MENRRLSKMAEGRFDEATVLTGTELNDDGSINFLIRTPAFRVFAGLMIELWKRCGAKNYVEQGVFLEDIGSIVITVQKVEGKSPHQMKEEWMAEALKLARHVRNTDKVEPLKWGIESIKLLDELRQMDPARYDAEVRNPESTSTSK
jgi:hypothetical protein